MDLNLPKYDFKIKHISGKALIFDSFRKKYVALTPEEYVRQSFALYLVNEKKYPKGLTAVEHSLKFYGMDRRADIVIYNPDGDVILITECKAPSVNITQKTFDQIARYNMQFKSRFLAVSNGLKHYCCEFRCDGTYHFLKDIPEYEAINK
jgi:hypothetical protein